MPGNPFTDPNWSANLAETLEYWTGRVRSVTTDNAVKASRALVYGVLALMAVATATPLAVILFTRLCQTVLSRVTRTDHGTTVWISYLITGVLFMVLGFIALRRRHAAPRQEH
jgi:hypothetical protein